MGNKITRETCHSSSGNSHVPEEVLQADHAAVAVQAVEVLPVAK